MNCIVTAGPTYEKMDNVRRLTNFSTGQLGTELANFLAARGHKVTLLLGETATYGGERRVQRVEKFSTTASLTAWFQKLSGEPVDAIFHAAAVSDFTFGKIWLRSAAGDLSEVKAGKISTRQGTLLAELLPTPKIIGMLRDRFPQTQIIGWKFEMDGNRADVLRAAERQMRDCRTDACVANGKAYGEGFGLLSRDGKQLHLPDKNVLFAALLKFIGA